MIWRGHRSEAGYVMVTALIALAVMSLLAIASLTQASSLLRMSRQAVRDEQALYLANAGVEFIYAQLLTSVRDGTEPRLHDQHVMALDGNVTGSYEVTAAEVRTGYFEILATGIITEGGIESARQVVEAELPVLPGGGSGGGGGGRCDDDDRDDDDRDDDDDDRDDDRGGRDWNDGGWDRDWDHGDWNSSPWPGWGHWGGWDRNAGDSCDDDDDDDDDWDDQAPAREVVAGFSSLALSNNTEICGDLFVNGNLHLNNNVVVWSPAAAARSKNVSCTSISGSGRVIVTGRLRTEHADIHGGWCDSDSGEGTNCRNKPLVRSITVPDFAPLKAQAQGWHLRPADQAFCQGRTNCTTLKNGLYTLSGTRTYANQLIYIDGDLTVPVGQNVVIAGRVTFAVTGNVTIDADVTCATGNACQVAFLAGGNLTVGTQKTTIWATLYAGNELNIDATNVTIHGLLSATKGTVKNKLILYPTQAWPTGIPGGPSEGPGGGITTVGPYTKWNQ